MILAEEEKNQIGKFILFEILRYYHEGRRS